MANLKDTLVLGNLTVTGKINGAMNSSSLPLAANGVRGGIQIGYSDSTKPNNLAVALDSEKAYISLPNRLNDYKASAENTPSTSGWYFFNDTTNESAKTAFGSSAQAATWVSAYDASWAGQLGISYYTDQIAFRRKNGSTTWGNWIELAKKSDIKNPTGYYWANINISANSDSTTAPTFSKITTTNGAKISGRYAERGDDEGLVIGRAGNSYAGLCLGDPSGIRSVFYLHPNNSAFWRFSDGSATYDIVHPKQSGTIATQQWVEDQGYKTTDSDTKVTQTVTSSSNTSKRPILLGYSYSDAATPSFSTATNTAYASHNIYVAPKDGYLYAKKLYSNGKEVITAPTSSTDNAIVRFNGTAGAVQNSNVTVSDSGYLSATYLYASEYLRINDDDNNFINEYGATDNFNSDIDTYYYAKGIALYDNSSEETYTLSYPARSGTLALKERTAHYQHTVTILGDIGSWYTLTASISFHTNDSSGYAYNSTLSLCQRLYDMYGTTPFIPLLGYVYDSSNYFPIIGVKVVSPAVICIFYKTTISNRVSANLTAVNSSTLSTDQFRVTADKVYDLSLY